MNWTRRDKRFTHVVIQSKPFFVFGRPTMKSVASEHQRVSGTSGELGSVNLFPQWSFFCWHTKHLVTNRFTFLVLRVQEYFSGLESVFENLKWPPVLASWDICRIGPAEVLEIYRFPSYSNLVPFLSNEGIKFATWFFWTGSSVPFVFISCSIGLKNRSCT